MPFDPSRDPHRRRNPLTGHWVVVSPHRTQRPWQGHARAPAAPPPAHDPSCPLCPGNTRGNGERNPPYTGTYVFANDFPALLADVASPPVTDDPLFELDGAAGECRVLCFSPRHDRSLSDLTPAELAAVVELWREQHGELIERHRWVQIFETRGEVSGASNPHPHGQVWASAFVPGAAANEADHQAAYRSRHGATMLVDVVEREVAADARIVAANEHWVVFVPFWAYWPYETLVVPRRPVASLTDLDAGERAALVEILPRMLGAFDRLFDTAFPYCSGWHSAPRDAAPGWQLHAHYYPPLLRSADVAKIPASYELLADVQRDLTPESAARALRALV